jgi:hypothetical protein
MSIGQFSSQVTGTMLEKVRPKMSYFLRKQESKLMQMFNKAAEKHQVSAWTDPSGAVLAWRVPVLLQIGGDYQAVSLDGGDLGTGSMQNTAYMTFGTFENNIAFNVPARANYATKTDEQAISKALQFSIGNAIKEMALYNEIGFFQDSTGILATSTTTASGAGTTATYTLETAAFNYIRIRGKGTLLDVYDSGNVLRSTNQRVTSISFANNTITVAGGSSYTPANGDVLAFPNIGTPGVVGTTTLAAGSWRNGLYTFNTTSTSGSLGGLSYSSAYELACNAVNGQGGFYTPSLLLSGRSQLVQRRDDEAYSGIIGICHQAQAASWYLQGVTISNWFRGASDKMIDIVPKYGDTFDAGGIEHHCARYANKSRVDWVSPKNFGWTQLSEIDFFQNLDGQKTFVGRSSSTGNPQAGFQFYVVNTRQLYSVDPGCSVVIYSLAVPAGQ